MPFGLRFGYGRESGSTPFDRRFLFILIFFKGGMNHDNDSKFS